MLSALFLACSAVMAVVCHRQYSAAGQLLLPLPQVLGATQGALASVLLLCGCSQRMCGGGARRADVLALGISTMGGLLLLSDALSDQPGYLHAQLWLLPCLGLTCAQPCGLRFQSAAPAVWCPLLAYAARLCWHCGRHTAEPCYALVAAAADGRGGDWAEGGRGLLLCAYVTLLLGFTAAASAMAWRGERTERDAFVAR